MLMSSWPLMTLALTRSTLTKSIGQTGSTSRWGPHVSDTGLMTSGPLVSGLGKRERKRLKGATGLKEVRAGLGWTIGSARDGAGRLGSSGWTARWTGLASPFLLLLFSLMAQRIGPEAAQLLLHLFLFLFSSFLLWLTSWSRRSASPSFGWWGPSIGDPRIRCGWVIQRGSFV